MSKPPPKTPDASLCQPLQENLHFAETPDAKIVKLKSNNVAGALLKFARENGIAHVIFGQSARSRWEITRKGSIINRFLREVKDAAVHVIPLEKEDQNENFPVSEEIYFYRLFIKPLRNPYNFFCILSSLKNYR